MKYKLEDIDKKNTLKVPDGYFEELPLKIQTRINNEASQPASRRIPKWSLTLASVALLVLTFIFILPEASPDAEQLLSEVSKYELLAYLDHMDLEEYEITGAFENSLEVFDLDESSMLEEIDIDNQSLDDVLLEYDLTDEYL